MSVSLTERGAVGSLLKSNARLSTLWSSHAVETSGGGRKGTFVTMAS